MKRIAPLPLSRRRRIAFASVTMALLVSAGIGTLLLLDLYLHRRVQNVAAVNVWGYRGPTVPAKRPDETRIVTLGGSTTFGFGLPWNESWPFYLERQLNVSGRDFFRVVNLGAPGQGAYGFTFDLADYAYLKYDVAVLYEGYNDLGRAMEFDPTPHVVNRYLWRRQSPVFRLSGYFPVLPLVFREKAMQLRAGGDLDAAYRGSVRFKPNLVTRATASALADAAGIADSLSRRLGALTVAPQLSREPLDSTTWRSYTESVLGAVQYARDRGVSVVVVTQPFISDAHVAQQRALASALSSRFGADSRVRYLNLGTLIDLNDRGLAYDGLHLVARANEMVARHLVDPIREAMAVRQGAR